MRKFALFYQDYPNAVRPWRIIETYITSDGWRSRICEGAWATREEAMEMLQLKDKM